MIAGPMVEEVVVVVVEAAACGDAWASPQACHDAMAVQASDCTAEGWRAEGEGEGEEEEHHRKRWDTVPGAAAAVPS